MRPALGALVLAVGCLSGTAHGQARDGSVAEVPSVYIVVQADGKHCVIRKVAITCADALTHLRQVLNLPPGTWVRFKAARAAPYEALKKLIDDVQHSEYATSIAYLLPPKEASK